MKIAFAHNVHNRYKTLLETIQIELNEFPQSKVYVAHNLNNVNKNNFPKSIKWSYFNGIDHKIGCVNGCITSIKSSLKDDYDVIVFSHDDVMINNHYIESFKKNIELIINNTYDIICRQPDTYGDNYYMMEGFFMSKKAAVEIFSGLNLYKSTGDIPKDLRNSPSPEVWLYNVLNSKKTKINCIKYKHQVSNYNKVLAENLGLLHKNAGMRGWND